MVPADADPTGPVPELAVAATGQLPSRAVGRPIQAAMARPALEPSTDPAAPPSITPTTTDPMTPAGPTTPLPKAAVPVLPNERRPAAPGNTPSTTSPTSDPAVASVDRQSIAATPAPTPARGPSRPAPAERTVSSTPSPAATTEADQLPAVPVPPTDAVAEPPADPAAVPAPVERIVTTAADGYARTGTPADPVSQIMPRIVHATLGQRQVVSVDLHPAELGRVDIRIAVDANRKVRATISAASAETVALLQRHVGGLEAALTATGLTLAGDDAVTFDLGTSSGQGEPGAERGDGGDGARERSPGTATFARPGRDEAAATQPCQRSRLEGVLDLVL